MGSDKGADDEKPISKVCFANAFWIDKIEVTQAQFKQFGGKQDSSAFFPGKNRPVEQISWAEASSYCVSRKARLPTEAEWEYAARGPDNLIYPWGDTFDEKALIWNRGNTDGTAEAGSKAAGASWVGALELSGNVYEWVSTLYKPYPYDAKDGRESDSNKSDPRVLRGGSWDLSDPALERGSRRYWDDPSYRINNIGFRCARSDQAQSGQTS
jgi:iron(II)-dependent oxidoreductase